MISQNTNLVTVDLLNKRGGLAPSTHDDIAKDVECVARAHNAVNVADNGIVVFFN